MNSISSTRIKRCDWIVRHNKKNNYKFYSDSFFIIFTVIHSLCYITHFKMFASSNGGVIMATHI